MFLLDHGDIFHRFLAKSFRDWIRLSLLYLVDVQGPEASGTPVD